MLVSVGMFLGPVSTAAQDSDYSTPRGYQAELIQRTGVSEVRYRLAAHGRKFRVDQYQRGSRSTVLVSTIYDGTPESPVWLYDPRAGEAGPSPNSCLLALDRAIRRLGAPAAKKRYGTLGMTHPHGGRQAHTRPPSAVPPLLLRTMPGSAKERARPVGMEKVGTVPCRVLEVTWPTTRPGGGPGRTEAAPSSERFWVEPRAGFVLRHQRRTPRVRHHRFRRWSLGSTWSH